MNGNHIRLVLPGPVEVREEILQAQTQWMIGHRTTDFAELFANVHSKLKEAFFTASRVYISGSSGSGLWEGAVRCAVRDDHPVLHLVSGAFSERWAEVSQSNGKKVEILEVDWGKGFSTEMISDAVGKKHYDAVCVVHNETSTGVLNPVKEIAEVVSDHDDTFLLVDTVSGFLGAELRFDDWGLDVALTSSQKAFALPPGLSFAAVSDRVLDRAREIPQRGSYFDFITLEKYLVKNNTPSTPPISLLFAAKKQLEDIMQAGVETRWADHLALRDRTHAWVREVGLDLFAEEGYWSPTVTTIKNTREIDVNAMGRFMLEQKGFAIDKGYGKIKGTTFRVPHMGDMTMSFLEEVLAGFSEFIEQAQE